MAERVEQAYQASPEQVLDALRRAVVAFGYKIEGADSRSNTLFFKGNRKSMSGTAATNAAGQTVLSLTPRAAGGLHSQVAAELRQVGAEAPSPARSPVATSEAAATSPPSIPAPASAPVIVKDSGNVLDRARGFWGRRSTVGKVLIAVGSAVALLVIVSAAVSSGNDSTSSPSAQTPSPLVTNPTPAAPEITGRLAGVFHRDCLLCSDSQLVSYVKTSNVWCGWKDGKVIIHVTMRNQSVEHVTVDWHPSYVIAGGAEHGTGLTSIQSSGFDSGETRDLSIEQDPKGVPDGSEISECKPSFSTIDSG